MTIQWRRYLRCPHVPNINSGKRGNAKFRFVVIWNCCIFFFLASCLHFGYSLFVLFLITLGRHSLALTASIDKSSVKPGGWSFFQCCLPTHLSSEPVLSIIINQIEKQTLRQKKLINNLFLSATSCIHPIHRLGAAFGPVTVILYPAGLTEKEESKAGPGFMWYPICMVRASNKACQLVSEWLRLTWGGGVIVSLTL